MASSPAAPPPSLTPQLPSPSLPPSEVTTPQSPPVSTPTVSPPPLPLVTPVASPPSNPPPPPPPSVPAASPPPLLLVPTVPPLLPPPTIDVSPPPLASPAPPLPVLSPPSPATAASPPTDEPIRAPPAFAPPPPSPRVSQQPPQRPTRPSPGKQTRQPFTAPNPPSVESPPGTPLSISPPPAEASPGGVVSASPPVATATPAPTMPPVSASPYAQPNRTGEPFTGNPVSSQPQMGIGAVNRSLPVAVGAQNREQRSVAPKSNAAAWIAGGATVCGVLLLVLLVWLLSRFSLRRKRASSSTRGSYHKKVGNHAIALQQGPFLLQDDPLSCRVNSDRSLLGFDKPRVPAASLSFSRGKFTYEELAEATDGFSDANLLGEGGFGYVHKGVQPDGREIAVKQLKIGSQQGEREFRAELEMITRVHHKHLVALMGYCITEVGRYLVYEFIPNNTLEFHLHSGGSSRPLLDWVTRMKIAIGSAKGIAYLHEDCSPKIIHRDIKAANILLDLDFDVKVSDFGLAKLFCDNNAQVTHISTRVVGTFGYLAPEYAATGKLTEKSDVYSYGVVLLELITGRPPIKRLDIDKNEGLVDSVRPLINQVLQTGNYEAIVDVRLGNNYDRSQMARMIRCAAACIRHSAGLRPQMSQIIRTLEEDGPLTELDDEGTFLGDSKLHCSAEMSKFYRVLATRKYSISKETDSTSEYGLYPSCSSSEFQQTM
ncbi:hypothetical protein MLD38_006158 [Melastoma candidum]|uniref:Uncharacterized protein n=1 Tax=Melastoma candidum TaxID=119954 RepID=A0ACB9RLD6_9MYRT|nr:hypothetical protein MLD38_006158 [Melastoma candidum]